MRRGWSSVLPVLVLTFAALGVRAESPHARCDDCHRGTVGEARTTPDVEVCLHCHGDLLQSDAVMLISSERVGAPSPGHVSTDLRPRFAIAPGGGRTFERFDCLSCHDAHSTEQPFQLRLEPETVVSVDGGALLDPTSRFCLQCHADFGKTRGSAGTFQRHPVGVPLSSRHASRPSHTRPPLFDVRGTSTTDDDVVGCTSCHTVHSSPNRSLLRWSAERQGEACGQCHEQGRSPAVAPGATYAARR